MKKAIEEAFNRRRALARSVEEASPSETGEM